MWPDSSINVANTVAEGQALSGKPVGAANHLLILLLQLFFQLVLGRPKIAGPIVPTVAVMRYDNVAGCAQLLQRCLPARCAPHRITRPIYADIRWRRLGIGKVEPQTQFYSPIFAVLRPAFQTGELLPIGHFYLEV